MRSRFEIYCDILYRGLVTIRNCANDPERCFAEADHLHNLPDLLRSFANEDLHRYYWEAMRPSFIGQSKPEWLGQYHHLWVELEEATRRETGEAVSGGGPEGGAMHEWIRKMVRHVQVTPPTCLRNVTAAPVHPNPWNDWTAWSLACSCGERRGKVLGYSLADYKRSYKGPELFISPLAFRCGACDKRAEILDTKKHGYNAEIRKRSGGSGDASYRGTGERKVFACPRCGASDFFVTVHFSYPHFDLMEDEPALEPHAQDFFHALDCRGACVACGNELSLANFETA
jgi:hypothetical protein